LIFEEGETENTFHVEVANDIVFESPDDSFIVTLSNPTNGSLLDEYGDASLVTIEDDGDAGTFSFTKEVYEIGEDRGHVTISVTRSGGSSTTVTVAYSTSDGDATSGSDYTSVDGVLTFEEGEVVQTFNVPITDDIEYEFPNEEFSVHLAGATGGSLLGTTTATVSINDERDLQLCTEHTSKADCAGTGPGGVCCIWVATGTNGTGVCRGSIANGFSEMLCRPRLPQ
jgi:hypothetical protein